jgi:hypothetical protein
LYFSVYVFGLVAVGIKNDGGGTRIHDNYLMDNYFLIESLIDYLIESSKFWRSNNFLEITQVCHK